MSALRDIVVGQGCSVDEGPSGTNPLAKLFSGIIDSSRKHERLQETGLTNLPVTDENKQKIANRAGIVTRHIYPGVLCSPCHIDSVPFRTVGCHFSISSNN